MQKLRCCKGFRHVSMPFLKCCGWLPRHCYVGFKVLWRTLPYFYAISKVLLVVAKASLHSSWSILRGFLMFLKWFPGCCYVFWEASRYCGWLPRRRYAVAVFRVVGSVLLYSCYCFQVVFSTLLSGYLCSLHVLTSYFSTSESITSLSCSGASLLERTEITVDRLFILDGFLGKSY